ncbi:MAG: LuxR C-terminal-related transcriptional regulator, partial [Chloroflexota bacterium]
LSIQGREDVDDFLASFSGENRYIVDYLVEEVLSRLPEDVQDFLLATSVLERFTAELCTAITGRDDARTLIERLETANLFLVALDSERQWYRYHQLFSDLLRQRLNQRDPSAHIQIARNASKWFEEQGVEAEAIHYAIHAGDGERIAELVEEVAERALHRGRIDTLASWLEAVPDELRRQRPKLSACAMWTRLSSGRIEEIPPFIAELEAAAADGSRPEEHQVILRGLAAAGHARLALQERDFQRTIEMAKIALDAIPDEMPVARSSTLYSRGFAEAWTGCVNDAAATFEESVSVSAAIESAPFYMINRTALGQCRLQQGRLRDADEVHRESLRFAEEQRILNWPFIGYVRINLGRVLYEQGDLDAALAETKHGIELAKDWSTIAYQLEGYYVLTLISLSHRDIQAARDALNNARRLVPITGPNPDLERIHAYQALIDLFEGNVTAARAWAEPQLANLPQNLDRLWNWWPVYRAALRIAGDTGDIQSVLLACDHMLEVADEACWGWGALQTRVSKARSLWQSDRREEAMAILQETLDRAEPEGFLRIFSHGGAEVRDILLALRPRQPSPAFVDRVLEQFGGPPSSNGQSSSLNDQLIEPLSERETEVLNLIVQGLTNAEIADALYVATGTVKTHAHNIYGKLGVRTRTQAVARARQLGLVAA